MNSYIDLEETSLGLKIILKEEGREEVLRTRYSHKVNDIWKRLLRPGKNIPREYFLLKPEMVGASTTATIIGKGLTMDEYGALHFNKEYTIWWFPDYQIVDEIEELLVTGYIYFSRA
jgi:hypothetical protein